LRSLRSRPPQEAFLSRQALTQTGSKLGDLSSPSLDALTFLLKYDPATAPTLPASAYWSEGGALSPSPDAAFSSPKNQSFANELLNLSSVLLYTTNYYIVSPTANSYAEILHAADASYGGALVGVASTAAICGAFL
jgi:hypothetical protein